jgi:hypothetical protein
MASFKVETKQLRGEITPTSGEHIFFDCNTGSASRFEGGFFITVRGITYGVSAHFYKSPTGTWTLGKEGEAPSAKFYHNMYISRRGSNVKSDISHTARVAVAELLTAEVERWLKDNQAALVEAQQDDTRREIEKREKEIADLEGKITTIKLEIAALRVKP